MSPMFQQQIKTQIALRWVGLEVLGAILLLLHVHWLTIVIVLYLLHAIFFSFSARGTAALALLFFAVIPLFVIREESETARELALSAVGFFAFALVLATRAITTMTIVMLFLSAAFLALHQSALAEDVSITAFFLFAAIVLFELKAVGSRKDLPTSSSPS